ncbi:MAG: hypothetical protein ABEJ08_01215 [Halobacteriaceae archaeon]
MKDGASDPFADVDDEATPDEAGGEPDADDSPDATGRDTDVTDAGAAADATTGRDISREDLGLVLRRDNVKDERPHVHQLFVQESTDRRAKDAERDLENALGEDVYRLDAREAIYLAGMRHLDDAATILREWGYDL